MSVWPMVGGVLDGFGSEKSETKDLQEIGSHGNSRTPIQSTNTPCRKLRLFGPRLIIHQRQVSSLFELQNSR